MKIDVWLFAKGVLMGAADLVPGVSGGTIAFITGIYEQLILSIKSVIPEFLQLLRHRKPGLFWSRINGSFLLTLVMGIFTSILLLSKLIIYLLETHPIPLWSFFMGLIVASVYYVAKDLAVRRLSNIVILLAGIGIALFISRSSPTEIEGNLLVAFLSGAIAICAMILPGISGSFILVLLGTYSFILGALQEFQISVLLVFMGGCLTGLLSIANVLAWAYAKHRQAVLALLTGFMIGALDKVWPWKETLSYRLNRHGEEVPLMQANISPEGYASLTGSDPQWLLALGCAAFAIVMVLSLEQIAKLGSESRSG